jgi:integrase
VGCGESPVDAGDTLFYKVVQTSSKKSGEFMAVRLTESAVKLIVKEGVKKDHGDSARGLFLRVWSPLKWTWNIRRTVAGKDYRLDIGNGWTVDEARELANDADKAIRIGANPFYTRFKDEQPAFLFNRIQKKLGPKAPPPAPPPAPIKPMSITWNQAVEEFIAEVGRTRRKMTAVSYKSCLTLSEMQRFANRPVREIARKEVAAAVKEISMRAERQAETTVIAVRLMFKFLAIDDMEPRTGVEEGRMAGLKARERKIVEADHATEGALHTPKEPELKDILDKLSAFPPRVRERDRLASLLLLYTCQRRRTVALARMQDFVEIEGYQCWRIPPLHRKTASMTARNHGAAAVGDHVIPLSPQAQEVVRQAMTMIINKSKGKKKPPKRVSLFPPFRHRRLDQTSDSMAPEKITETFATYGFGSTPHDIRRGFSTTYGKFADMSLSDTKLVLDHSEGIPPEDVTAKHYRFMMELKRKDAVLRGWADWLHQQ